MKSRTNIWLVSSLLALISCSTRQAIPPETYVVMVSFDGFRWDYPQLYDTPSFDAMEKEGVKAERLIPSFPTKTFPNHYTLVTGLYPDHHGIINNSFYAPDLGGIYQMGDWKMVSDPHAYSGEPIWVNAEKQGVKSASYFWVGSEAPLEGTYPTYWNRYDESVPYRERVDQVISWLKLPARRRPGLILLYFDEPDGVGHDYGPVHDSTGAVVQKLDHMLGYLRSELSQLDMGDRINLIVVSDHGMGAVSPQRYVNLKAHIPEEWAESIIGGNPVYLIDPEEGYADSITLALSGVKGISAWEADDIPPHLHYGTSPRFPGIVAVADSTWSIGTRPDPSGYKGGAHGYDPSFTSMHAIFYAEGPAFKNGYNIPVMHNVDVYGILAMVLGLKPASNDGDPARVTEIFSLQDP
jgi:alkaline phosphatase D